MITNIENGYIVSVIKEGKVDKEYDAIVELINARPIPEDGYEYRLTENMKWELHELPPADPDPELSAEEALDIILGGDANEAL